MTVYDLVPRPPRAVGRAGEEVMVARRGVSDLHTGPQAIYCRQLFVVQFNTVTQRRWSLTVATRAPQRHLPTDDEQTQ